MDLERFETINQTHAHEDTSNRYSFIPTKRVLDVLADHNWLPSKVMQASVRDVGKQGFQRHLVRLRNSNYGTDCIVGQAVPEIVLINSHGGSSSFQLKAGVFRLVCSNGMVVGNDWADHRIRHMGYTDAAIENAIQNIVSSIPRLADAATTWEGIMLDRPKQEALAKAAIELRFDGDTWAAEPKDVLRVRRMADSAPTLWNTFNILQENLVKGCRATTATGQRRWAREVKSIPENIKLNQALWTLTERMAELMQ